MILADNKKGRVNIEEEDPVMVEKKFCLQRDQLFITALRVMQMQE